MVIPDKFKLNKRFKFTARISTTIPLAFSSRAILERLTIAGLSVGSRVSSDDVRGVLQVGRSANQINRCDPDSPDSRAANT